MTKNIKVTRTDKRDKDRKANTIITTGIYRSTASKALGVCGEVLPGGGAADAAGSGLVAEGGQVVLVVGRDRATHIAVTRLGALVGAWRQLVALLGCVDLLPWLSGSSHISA